MQTNSLFLNKWLLIPSQRFLQKVYHSVSQVWHNEDTMRLWHNCVTFWNPSIDVVAFSGNHLNKSATKSLEAE